MSQATEVAPGTPVVMAPAAQASLAEAAVMSFSWSPAGLGTCTHFFPFHTRMRV